MKLLKCNSKQSLMKLLLWTIHYTQLKTQYTEKADYTDVCYLLAQQSQSLHQYLSCHIKVILKCTQIKSMSNLLLIPDSYYSSNTFERINISFHWKMFLKIGCILFDQGSTSLAVELRFVKKKKNPIIYFIVTSFLIGLSAAVDYASAPYSHSQECTHTELFFKWAVEKAIKELVIK